MQETPVQFLDWGRHPGEGKGYPLQYSGLENSMTKKQNTTDRISLFTSFTQSFLKSIQIQSKVLEFKLVLTFGREGGFSYWEGT